jgi:hypothetical protein
MSISKSSHSPQRLPLKHSILAVALLAWTVVGVYAACYKIVHPPCTTAGAFAGWKQNPSDQCPDKYYWLQDSQHNRCYTLHATPTFYGQQKSSGKTNCTSFPNGQLNVGTWNHEYRVWNARLFACQYWYELEEDTSWRCDDASLGGSGNCEGYE